MHAPTRTLVLSLVLSLGPIACGEDPGVTAPDLPQEHQLSGNWVITIPAGYEVTVSTNDWTGRQFTATRKDGRIRISSYSSDLLIPDFEAIEDPLPIGEAMWDLVDTVENSSGGVNALYSPPSTPMPPLPVLASALICEKTTGTDRGKYRLLALVSFEPELRSEVLELIASVREVVE